METFLDARLDDNTKTPHHSCLARVHDIHTRYDIGGHEEQRQDGEQAPDWKTA
jgi:hypothetical protein